MTNGAEKIPFAVEISRMIELLAAQIYPSPFALLRENVQNAFDAILLRRGSGVAFVPTIDVFIEPTRIRVVDNGIGMSREDLRNHFWRAGSSSKNTPEARAAGVVGTFGIGAMANFGIAEELTVVTESALTSERTWCSAKRSTLSVTTDCIDFRGEPAKGQPGTEVTAVMQEGKSVNVQQAVAYVTDFARFVDLPINVNGQLVSQRPLEEAVPKLAETWSFSEQAVEMAGALRADVELTGAITGEVRIDLSNIVFGGQALPGRMILRQSGGSMRTLRSRFGLAAASVQSAYQFGGVADFTFLQPTAGREALTVASLQTLQQMMPAIDEFVSRKLASRAESNANSFFVAWVGARALYDLCSRLRVRVEPGDSATLEEVRSRSQASPFLVYAGADPSTLKHASEDRRVIALSHGSPRRDCELGFLRSYCKIEELTDDPKVQTAKKPIECTIAESALAFRLASILSSDYFLAADVRFGTISHGLPILVTKRTAPVEIYLDPSGTTVRMMLDIYDREYVAFGHMAKDFVRNVVFPRVADLVPSATRQGAEAFLKTIQRTREVFEYEAGDLESLASLWQDYLAGKLDMQQASARASSVASRSYQELDGAAAARVRDVVPDVIDNENATARSDDERRELGALPSIQRLDIETDRKLLTIADEEPPLKGYRCFLALSDRVREDKGDFFLQPHRTSVVWGGQKALFVFEHHSGEFGLYYDVQTPDLVGNEPGGGAFETCTIVMKNRIFIPLPDAIRRSFVPTAGERKRLEVRCDILHIDRR